MLSWSARCPTMAMRLTFFLSSGSSVLRRSGAGPCSSRLPRVRAPRARVTPTSALRIGPADSGRVRNIKLRLYYPPGALVYLSSGGTSPRSTSSSGSCRRPCQLASRCRAPHARHASRRTEPHIQSEVTYPGIPTAHAGSPSADADFAAPLAAYLTVGTHERGDLCSTALRKCGRYTS